ncbi:hypothetical protein IA69_05750 [Massilia sp. JS1662]|nr:hypothetical protein IA69_05750 [Massilia sp. JS1662]
MAREPACRERDVDRAFSLAGNGQGHVAQGQVAFQAESIHHAGMTGPHDAHVAVGMESAPVQAR